MGMHKMLESMIQYVKGRGIDVIPYSQCQDDQLKQIGVFETYKKHDAFCLHGNSLCAIFYNDAMSEYAQCTAFAHEIGHTLLEGWDEPSYHIFRDSSVKDWKRGEFMANMFECIISALYVWNKCLSIHNNEL